MAGDGGAGVIGALAESDPAEVGGYRLLGRLGAGGMGTVFLGVSPGARLAAVKLVHPEYAADPSFRARFRIEVRFVPSVSGAFTAPVLDADPEAEVPWLAVLYVPALTLREAVARFGVLPEPAVRALGAALAEALRSIHSGGLVHRDLKPGNVLLSKSGPLVIDFGISRALDATRVTRTGTVIGTVGYMPPEQLLSDRTLGPPGDVFALGAVLTFAATGATPFGGGRPEEVGRRVVREAPQLDAVPEGLRGLIAACLEKNPAARPTTDNLLRRLSAVDLGALASPPLLAAVQEREVAAVNLVATLAAPLLPAFGSVADLVPNSALAPAVAIAPPPAGLAPPSVPWLTRRRFLAIAGGGTAALAAAGTGLALTQLNSGSGRPSWTATMPASYGAAVNPLPTRAPTIGVFGDSVVLVATADAAAYSVDSGKQLWTWNTASGAGPQVSGALAAYPCGLDATQVYGWGMNTSADILFTTSGRGAVTAQWSTADSYAAGDLLLCARAGNTAVFIESLLGVDDKLTAIDLTTGQLMWNFALVNAGTANSFSTTSVTADAKHCYVQDGPTTYALSLADGQTVWGSTTTADDNLPTDIEAANGVLLVGSSQVAAVNPADGKVLWRSSSGNSTATTLAERAEAAQGPYFSLLSVVGGIVYFCDGVSQVQALDAATGKQKWRYTSSDIRVTLSGTYASPVGFASKELLAVAVPGGFRTLDPANGQVMRTYQLPGVSAAAPVRLAVAGPSVYAGSGTTLYAFEGAS